MEKKSILQTIILIIVVTISGFLGVTMPIVALAYPIILTFIGLKNGIKKSVITFISSLILIGFITGNLNVLIIPFQYGLLSVFTVYMIDKKYKVNKIILYSASLVFLMVLLHMGLKWYFTGINTFMELEQSLDVIVKEQIKILKTGDMSETEISQTSNLIRNMKDYISSIMPVLLMLSSAFIAYVNYYVSSRLARKSGRLDIKVPEFSKIIFPRDVIVGLSIVLLISYILKYVGNFNYIQLLSNIFILMFMVFLIEGLSLTMFLINKMKMSRFIKTLFITIIILSSFLNIVLFSIGVMDIIIDFRKLRRES